MKAILVIDMPNECDECPLQDGERCYARQDWISTISNWRCPLKPMPNKRVPDGSETDQIYGCYVGWNACLEVLEDSQNAEDSNE